MCPCVATSVKNSIKHIYRTINIIIIFILNDKYQLDGKLMGVCVEGEAWTTEVALAGGAYPEHRRAEAGRRGHGSSRGLQ
jgi:hypothetical protein